MNVNWDQVMSEAEDSPSAYLRHALGDAEANEIDTMILAWMNKDGQTFMRSAGWLSHALGLADWAAADLRDRLVNDREITT